MNGRFASAVWGLLISVLAVSCGERTKTPDQEQRRAATLQNRDYLPVILAMDTLSFADYRKAIYREDSLLRHQADSANPYAHFFRARRYVLENQFDSARMEYEKMAGDSTGEIAQLKRYGLLALDTRSGRVVDGVVMDRLLSSVKTAERLHSKLTYKFYDLVARSYYQNENEKESLDYSARYFKHHPYQSHPVIQQRYYDISFLLSARMGDADKMADFNSKARRLAEHIGDSLAIARTFDNDAQIYAKRGQFDKTLASSRLYYEYLKRTNNMNETAPNNLGNSLLKNNLPDSAIPYFREAIALSQKNSGGLMHPSYLKGLVESYKKKKDYEFALEMIDSAYGVEIKRIREIEAVRIADIEKKYEAEKKDQSIAELNSRNTLNEKIIRQQRWTLVLAFLVFVGVLSFFYFMHRQYRLTEKNKLLQSENRRLNMEHKLLQAQLNPHFIFNSVANLQSLIATGDTKESVRYLSAFSGLLRNVLEQSRRDFISLEEEIVSLEHYLQLQQMRFAGLFDYRISVAEQLHQDDLLIPPMLVQPFVENAIEHGFRNIGYKGLLSVSFRSENGRMLITVDDNGTGLGAKVVNGQKKQSLAGTILKERLDVLFNSRGQEAKFEIENKKENGRHGVTVHIVIPAIKD